MTAEGQVRALGSPDDKRGGLHWGGSNRGGEKQIQDMFLKVETMGLLIGL